MGRRREAQASVRNAKGDTVTSGKAALAKGARTVEIEVPVVEGMAGDVKVQVRVSGNGALARYTDTTSVALDAMPAGWGAPRLSRRGPSTGVAWVPTRIRASAARNGCGSASASARTPARDRHAARSPGPADQRAGEGGLDGA